MGSAGTVLHLKQALIWSILSTLAAGSAQAGKIQWREDLDAAKVEAKDQGKLVWVQFTSPWCGTCRRMDQDAFGQDRVTTVAAARFTSVRLRSDLHEAFAVANGFKSLPATLILRPDGSVVAKIQGYMGAVTLSNFLIDCLKVEGKSPEIEAPEASPDPPEKAESAPGIGLGGYCPVSLIDEHCLIRGTTLYPVFFEGRVFRFAGLEQEAKFRKEPRRYFPLNGENCPVAQVDHGERILGNPGLGLLYEEHLYLFATPADRLKFLENPTRYARAGDSERYFCIHCWADARLGKPTPRLALSTRR